MNREIEKKFLVDQSKLPNLNNVPWFEITQGYLSAEPVVRIRLQKTWQLGVTDGFLTIKGPGLENHLEFEKTIGYENAKELLPLCKTQLTKKRYLLPVNYDRNLRWDLDFFTGENEGLIIAEIELPEENYFFEKPEWLLEEVTMDSKYSNSFISSNPYNTWKK